MGDCDGDNKGEYEERTDDDGVGNIIGMTGRRHRSNTTYSSSG